MSVVRWLDLRTSRALKVTGIVIAAITVVAWGRTLTLGGQPWPAAIVFLLGHGLGLMVACLVGLLLNPGDGATTKRALGPPRFVVVLPLLEVPLLIVVGLILWWTGQASEASWGWAVLLPLIAQLIMIIAWALSVWVIVPLIRALAKLIDRARPTSHRNDADGLAGALLILTVLGGVMFIAGTMLAGLSPDSVGTRAGLLRAALRSLWSDTGDASLWAWIGRVGLILLLLGGAPLVLARRG